MNKSVVYILLCLLNCIEFDFVSEDEDANGMYLELTASYHLDGSEIAYEDDALFVLDHDYNDMSSISCFYFSGDSIAFYACYEANYRIHDFIVNGSYVYAASEQGFDIINFDYGPGLYSTTNTPPASCIAICNARAYVASNSTLYIIDITDLRNPGIESIMSFPQPIQSLAVDSAFVFVHIGNNTVCTVSVQNPGDPVLTATMNLPVSGPYYLHVQHGYLYAFNKYDDFILVYTIEPTGLNRNHSSLSLPNVNHAYFGDEYGLVLGNDELLLVDMRYTPVLAVTEKMQLLETPLSGVIDEETIYLLIYSHLLVVKIRSGV